MTHKEKYKEILKCVKKTKGKLKSIYDGCGTFETPVDMDMIKTTKAMFYEEVAEILRK